MLAAAYIVAGALLLFPVLLVYLILLAGLVKAVEFVPWHMLRAALELVLDVLTLGFVLLDMTFNATWGWVIYREPPHFRAALGFLPLPEVFSSRVERSYRAHCRNTDPDQRPDGVPEALDAEGAKSIRWATFINTFNAGDITFPKG